VKGEVSDGPGRKLAMSGKACLPYVRQPAKVVHRRDDRAIPYRFGREVAPTIPGATFVPLQGPRSSRGTVMSIPSSARDLKG
jgi:hypothetical protein